MKSIKSSTIKGTISAPASKSIMQRALAAALLTGGTTRILNPTYCHDSLAAMRVISALGAKITQGKDEVIVVSGGIKPTYPGMVINCGESGLSIRMFSPIAALWRDELTLTGEGSLLSRPVSMIEAPLKELGVQVITTNGFPPLKVKGPLLGGEAEVDGSLSSQLLTGLLMALPVAPRDSRLIVKNLKSTPYIAMTLALLDAFQIKVRHLNYETFLLAGAQRYTCPKGEYWVEGDWSGVSFLLTAGAVAGWVTVTRVDTASLQADRQILEALTAAGASVITGNNTVTVRKNQLKGFTFDATHCPDLFPPLVALACHCEGTTVLTGAERLAHKESNRAAVLEKEFSMLGADIHCNGDRMEIKGTELHGGIIDSHNDHRIAMAAAVAALNIKESVTIRGDECAAKSYPDFFADLNKIGGNVYE